VSADSSQNQITLVTIPHFTNVAIIDPTFSYLVDEAPRSTQTEDREGGISPGVAVGVSIAVIFVVVVIVVALVMPRIIRNNKEKILMMGRMDSFESQSSKRKSTIKSSERKSIIQSVGAPSIQVSVVSDSETENKSKIKMNDFKSENHKEKHATRLF